MSRQCYFVMREAKNQGFDTPSQTSGVFAHEFEAVPQKKRNTLSAIPGQLRVLDYRPPQMRQAEKQADEEEEYYTVIDPNMTWGYSPCNHPGKTCEEAGDDCTCVDNLTYCDKFCSCSLDCALHYLVAIVLY